MKRTFSLALAFLPSLALLGCGSGDIAQPEASDGEVGEVGLPEAWDTKNNPSSVDTGFIYDVNVLPLAGQTKVAPIPSDYWGTYNDSIAYRWDGADSLSPAEKYEKAFNQPGLALRISELYGIRKQTQRRECTKEADCKTSTTAAPAASPAAPRPAAASPRGGASATAGRPTRSASRASASRSRATA